MKRFRLLAFLLPVVFVFAASTVASASTDSASPAATLTNYIINDSSGIGLGVIHVHDGVYTDGNYDAVLPAGTNTYLEFGWTTTAGWYVGPGYCTHQSRYNPNTGNFEPQLPDLGPGQHFIGANTLYAVTAYKASSCG